MAAKAKTRLKQRRKKRGAERGSVKQVTMNDIITRRFFRRAENFRPHRKSVIAVKKMREADLKKRYKRLWEKREAEEAAQSVTMFRKYRQGELPDIQIHHRELLAPLQALHCDPVIAEQLFLMVFKAIYQNLDKMQQNPVDANMTRTSISEAVAYLLSASGETHNPSPSFVYSLHLITMQCGKIDSSFTHTIDTNKVVKIGKAALESKNFHSGALLLEHMLANPVKEGQPPSLKKRRATVSDVEDDAAKRDQEVWFQLARLYRELGEDDVVMSLYSHFANWQMTKDAIAAQLRGDHFKAQNIFFEALDLSESGGTPNGKAPTHYELDHWDDERLECCHQLTEWETLRDNVLVQMDNDISKIWSQDDMYLRHYIASTIKIPDKRSSLYEFFEEGIKIPQVRPKLEGAYAADLSFVYALEGAAAKAQFYLQQSYNYFLNSWSHLPQLAKGPRLRLLNTLQKLLEIEEFLKAHPDTCDIASNDLTQLHAVKTSARGGARASGRNANLEYSGHQSLTIAEEWDVMEARIRSTVERWATRFPSSIDNISVWDDVIVNRKAYLDRLRKGLRARLDLVDTKAGRRDDHRHRLLQDLSDQMHTVSINAYRRASAVVSTQNK